MITQTTAQIKGIIEADRAVEILKGVGWKETKRSQLGCWCYITLRKWTCAEAAAPPEKPTPPKPALAAMPPPPPPIPAKPKAPPPPPPPLIPEPPKPLTPEAPISKAPIYSREWWLDQGYTGHWHEWWDNPQTKRKQWLWDQPLGSKVSPPIHYAPPPKPLEPEKPEYLKPPPPMVAHPPTPEEIKRDNLIMQGYVIPPGASMEDMERIVSGMQEQHQIENKIQAITGYIATGDLESITTGDQEYTSGESRILEIYGPEALKEHLQVLLEEAKARK